jgi:hypothetical protein
VNSPSDLPPIVAALIELAPSEDWLYQPLSQEQIDRWREVRESVSRAREERPPLPDLQRTREQ